MIIDKLAIKPLLITIGVLALALSISLFANVKQYRAGAIADTAHAAELVAARNTGEIDALKDALERSASIAEQAEAERLRIEQQLIGINAENARLQYEYQMAIALLPPLPAQCGPGIDRVDAFNRR
jgi:hypothetical protein